LNQVRTAQPMMSTRSFTTPADHTVQLWQETAIMFGSGGQA